MKAAAFFARNKTPLLLSAILLLTAAIYWPVVHYDFLWDDQLHVTNNETIRSLDAGHLSRLFREQVAATYVPLTLLSFSVEYRFFGYNSFVYHLDNLLLHLAVTALVFVFARQAGLQLYAAFIATLLFGIHPLHVESVVWVTARKDLLYSFFYLLALIQYWRYIHSGSSRPYILTVIFAGLGILAKPMALSLPLVLWLCDWLAGRKPEWVKLVVEKLPHLFIIAPISLITFTLNARLPQVDLWDGLLTWVWTFAFYIQKFFVPVALRPIYSLPRPVELTHWPIAAGALVFIVFWSAVWFGRKNRIWLFAVLYYILSIFFLLRTDDIYDNGFVADRHMYLPCLGFCFAVGVAADKLIAACQGRAVVFRRAAGLVALAALLSLMAATRGQTMIWRDSLSLFGSVVDIYPDNALVRYNLGLGYLVAGDKETAMRHFLAAVRLRPDYPMAHGNLGNLFFEKGRVTEAVVHFQEALRLRPEYVEAHNNYGVLLMGQGNLDEGQLHITEAVRLAPDNSEAMKNLGNLYYLKKELASAIFWYNRSLGSKPDSPYLHNMLGNIYYGQGDLGRARRHFREVLIYEPNNPAVHNSLGAIALKAGEVDEAISHFQEVLRLDPASLPGRQNLAAALALKNKATANSFSPFLAR